MTNVKNGKEGSCANSSPLGAGHQITDHHLVKQKLIESRDLEVEIEGF